MSLLQSVQGRSNSLSFFQDGSQEFISIQKFMVLGNFGNLGNYLVVFVQNLLPQYFPVQFKKINLKSGYCFVLADILNCADN